MIDVWLVYGQYVVGENCPQDIIKHATLLFSCSSYNRIPEEWNTVCQQQDWSCCRGSEREETLHPLLILTTLQWQVGGQIWRVQELSIEWVWPGRVWPLSLFSQFSGKVETSNIMWLGCSNNRVGVRWLTHFGCCQKSVSFSGAVFGLPRIFSLATQVGAIHTDRVSTVTESWPTVLLFVHMIFVHNKGSGRKKGAH